MIEFPKTIPEPDYPLTITLEDNSISSKFEDGTVQSRRKFTRSRSTYNIQWNSLETEHVKVLLDFIKNKIHFKALTFLWKNPITGEVKEVRCMEVADPQMRFINRWSVSMKLQEI